MKKIFTAIGLMSGTSMDGVDLSIIDSDGEHQYNAILNKYFEYGENLYNKLTNLKEKINKSEDLKTLSGELISIEKELTFFNAKAVETILKEININIDFIGFHGQTIFHNPKEKITKQLGDGQLLSQLTKKKVVYDFRKNDLNNGGEGAPLAPVFHKLIAEQNKIKLPVVILNIGGISNITSISNNFKISSLDIGPGNCLIDKWVRLNSNKKFDEKGLTARSGTIDKSILAKSLENFYNSPISKNKSYDTNDFDLSFAKRLTLENGAATLTEFTADICSKKLINKNIYVVGGGRKNTFLIDSIKNKTYSKIKSIDEIGVDGDFIESQAFAYLAIRSFLKLPISYPETTGCKKPCTGGEVVKNF